MSNSSNGHSCLACGKRITWQFALCRQCEKVYGSSMKDWPEWLAFLWRDEIRVRRQDKRVKDNEVTFVDLPPTVAADDRVDTEDYDDGE